MLPAQRQREILEALRGQHSVKAEDLAVHFGVSVETVRRDLRQLARKGLLERVYGGAAVPLVSAMEESFDQRRVHYAQEKAAIAALAVGLLEDGETILIDVGTTCHEFAKAIPTSWSGRVVTSSVLAAVELAGRTNVEIILAGGLLRSGDLSCSGHYASQVFDDFYLGSAFVASGEVHPTSGLTDFNQADAEIRRDWLNRVGKAYLLADSSKLGGVAPCRISPLARFTALITDDHADPQLLNDFAKEDVVVLVAPTDERRQRDIGSRDALLREA